MAAVDSISKLRGERQTPATYLSVKVELMQRFGPMTVETLRDAITARLKIKRRRDRTWLEGDPFLQRVCALLDECTTDSGQYGGHVHLSSFTSLVGIVPANCVRACVLTRARAQ
jgi:hypothetical protein